MLYKYIFLRIFPAFILCITSAACGSSDNFVPDADPDATALVIFEDANNFMRGNNYVKAAESFTKLKEEYPFSPYAIEAELSLADCYYLDKEWLLAVDAYKEFETMHPRHESMPYVLYQIAEANLQTYTSVDRPPTKVAEAQAFFTRLRDSYPRHEYAAKAEGEIVKCRRILAEYEVYSGDFFFRTENYRAAWRRYLIVVQNFPELADLYAYADQKRHVAYFKYLENNNEQKRRERENTWHNWFNWL